MADRDQTDSGTDKRYVRRDDKGRIKSDDVARSLAADRRRDAQRDAPTRQGERGDR